MPLLAGKTALITGGSRGLGRALVETFTSEGARVAFSYARDEDGAKGTAAAAPGARAFRVSVLDAPGTEAMIAEVEQAWGGIDVAGQQRRREPEPAAGAHGRGRLGPRHGHQREGHVPDVARGAARHDSPQARRRAEHRLAGGGPDDGGARPLLREQGGDQGAERGARQGGRPLRHPRALPGARAAGGRRRPQPPRLPARRLPQTLFARPPRDASPKWRAAPPSSSRTPTATCRAKRSSSTGASSGGRRAGLRRVRRLGRRRP